MAQRCSADATRANEALSSAFAASPLQDQAPQLQATQAYMDCIGDFQFKVGLLRLSGLPLLAAVTALLYWFMPRWIFAAAIWSRWTRGTLATHSTAWPRSAARSASIRHLLSWVRPATGPLMRWPSVYKVNATSRSITG